MCKIVFFSVLLMFSCGSDTAIGPETGPNHEEGDLVITLPGGAKMAFIWIEPGTFMMGDPDSVKGVGALGKPQHEVTLTKGYNLGKYEVTQRQWLQVMGTKPWESEVDSTDPEDPVFNISWNDAEAFLSKINTLQTTYRFRFPTEAEWEYACRAGTSTTWFFGNFENPLQGYAWYNQNAFYQPRQVGLKLPNPWGLYDMYGNVREYVSDWYGIYSAAPQTDPKGPAQPPTGRSQSDSGILVTYYDKMNRGGSHVDGGTGTRSAVRGVRNQGFSYKDAGFRVVVSVVQ